MKTEYVLAGAVIVLAVMLAYAANKAGIVNLSRILPKLELPPIEETKLGDINLPGITVQQNSYTLGTMAQPSIITIKEPGSSCGCSEAGLQLVAGINDIQAELGKKLGAQFDNYLKMITDSVPDYLKQFIGMSDQIMLGGVAANRFSTMQNFGSVRHNTAGSSSEYAEGGYMGLTTDYRTQAQRNAQYFN